MSQMSFEAPTFVSFGVRLSPGAAKRDLSGLRFNQEQFRPQATRMS